MPENKIDHIDFEDLNGKAISKPLINHIYTADPSAHVFNGKIYIYPSHDIDAGDAFDDLGSHFAMEDYHVISMESPQSEAVDHGMALHVKDVPWAGKQMWRRMQQKKTVNTICSSLQKTLTVFSE